MVKAGAAFCSMSAIWMCRQATGYLTSLLKARRAWPPWLRGPHQAHPDAAERIAGRLAACAF